MAARQLDFAGKSGAVYRFAEMEDARTLSPMGGNFLYVRMDGDRPTVLYAGETENLHKGFDARWNEAKTKHAATHVFTRLNVAGAVRRAERDDVAAQYTPPMNPSGA